MQALCLDCTWRIKPNKHMEKVVGQAPTCLAFYPRPIPDDILLNEFSHDVVHPQQDNNLVYQSVTVFKKT